MTGSLGLPNEVDDLECGAVLDACRALDRKEISMARSKLVSQPFRTSEPITWPDVECWFSGKIDKDGKALCQLFLIVGTCADDIFPLQLVHKKIIPVAVKSCQPSIYERFNAVHRPIVSYPPGICTIFTVIQCARPNTDIFHRNGKLLRP